MGVYVDMSAGAAVGVSVGHSANVPVGLCACTAVDVSVGLSVDKPVGLSLVPRLAVAMVIAVEFDVELAVELAMASAMGLQGVPRHSVEAHGIPVEARGRSAVAHEVSAVVRRTPWK